jgi:hypothetical protein
MQVLGISSQKHSTLDLWEFHQSLFQEKLVPILANHFKVLLYKLPLGVVNSHVTV